MLFVDSQVVSACQSFRPVAPFFFLTKLPLLPFFYIEGLWPYRHANDVSLDTMILNVCGFEGLT